MFTPLDYQVEMAEEGYAILKKYGIVYLAAEERVRKTLPAIMIAEKCQNVKRILVVAPTAPIAGWHTHFDNYTITKEYKTTTYHSAYKLEDFNPDLVICDEAHNCIGGFPKQSKINKQLSKITKNKPIIYISATPHAQGYSSLYHQFKLSSWSPWKKYKTFYKWFGVYGVPNTVWVQSVQRPVYTTTVKELVEQDINHLFITKTRKEVGFEQEPEDKAHYIELAESTKKIYNHLVKHKILEFNNIPDPLVCDTASKLRFSLHMLEGGTLKINKVRHEFRNKEKINYILDTWGDTDQLVIFYYYKQELIKLQKHFKKAKILHSTTHAEGIDLWEYDTVVVYSQDWRTAKYTQRRARQTSLHREKPIIIHYLLVKGGISDQCYECVVTNKVNFVDSRFKETEL